MTINIRNTAFAFCLLFVSTVLVGCGDNDNRQPTEAEVKAADANRQKLIENLNVPEDQKAQMRAHMGGSAAPNPAEEARKNAASAAGSSTSGQEGRRN